MPPERDGAAFSHALESEKSITVYQSLRPSRGPSATMSGSPRRRKATAQSIDRAPIEDADRNDLASLLTRSFRTWNHESTQAAGLWWRPSSLESEPSNVRR
jgi:hypothetical protein